MDIWLGDRLTFLYDRTSQLRLISMPKSMRSDPKKKLGRYGTMLMGIRNSRISSPVHDPCHMLTVNICLSKCGCITCVCSGYTPCVMLKGAPQGKYVVTCNDKTLEAGCDTPAHAEHRLAEDVGACQAWLRQERSPCC